MPWDYGDRGRACSFSPSSSRTRCATKSTALLKITASGTSGQLFSGEWVSPSSTCTRRDMPKRCLLECSSSRHVHLAINKSLAVCLLLERETKRKRGTCTRVCVHLMRTHFPFLPTLCQELQALSSKILLAVARALIVFFINDTEPTQGDSCRRCFCNSFLQEQTNI